MAKLLEYYVTDDWILCFVVGPGLPSNPVVHRVRFAYRELSALVNVCRQGLVSPTESLSKPSTLSALLLEPLFRNHWISRHEPLYVVPHRCLRSLPFHTLYVEDELLLETNPITYLPVATPFPAISSPSKLSSGVVIKRSASSDGALLRASFDREATLVATRTGSVLLADADARLDNIEAAARDRPLLHFTCHGLFDGSRPSESGLLLAGSDGRDCLVKSEDISRLRLHAELVVLAACETALSERHPGDELMGLVRAFMTAGAKHVVATLWPVHSMATEWLITRFYEFVSAGDSYGRALQRSQLALRAVEESALRAEIRSDVARQTSLSGEAASLLQHRLDDVRFDPRNSASRSAAQIRQSSETNSRNSMTRPFFHPYYWSPFVLMRSHGE